MNKRHAIYQWFRDHAQQVDLCIMLGLFLVAAVPYLFMDDVPGFVVGVPDYSAGIPVEGLGME